MPFCTARSIRLTTSSSKPTIRQTDLAARWWVATLERQVKAQTRQSKKICPRPICGPDPKTGMGVFCQTFRRDKGFLNNPYEDWAKNGENQTTWPGLKDSGKSKKNKLKKNLP